MDIYKFPFQIKIDVEAIDRAVRNFAVTFDVVLKMMRNGLNGLLNSTQALLTIIPWWVLVLLVVFLGYKQTGKIKTGIVYGLMLSAIGIVGLWGLMLTTLSIVIASVALSVLMGFPIGLLISTSDRANRWVRPILDTMQTMPVFVYLIPAVLLFGLGKTPAVIATTIYAIVPIIRLTNLGIRQVDSEVVEAAKAFGSTKSQAMMKVQIPQAWPTIMAGVNQTLMMAMAMVVTASMIGAAGLGMEVLISVNRVEVGRGLVSGTAVVLLAILLDRLSQGWTKDKKEDV
ncbi:MAG: choline ABC transporter permease subunit [Firmicutes bacterium HGW-Firmicutes-20]|jgi:ABC-type proline/glycine betaine transport system permease subunit|nr:ABC transporter permease subunit [Erysipelotrichaceae bacterium]PKM64482.1 MAG: choline ABC transporter permease subunit [Firmicutes bacterium HGW-Firmicutes-20]PKM89247.1 MAG: choline ABC transporter permease subunit [Firmicutes bacterium HGW-Firmicutes-10]